MLKLPIRSKIKPTVTQEFGSLQNSEFYKANGLPSAHNGMDIIVGDDITTYGTELVNPLPYAYLSKRTYDTALSSKGNGITIGGTYNGKEIQIVLWHLSSVAETESFKEGWTLGNIGNSGLCIPGHSYKNPYGGAHLHLMVYEYDGLNWILKNPRDYFDCNTWYGGQNTNATYDAAPVLHYMQKWIDSAKAFLGIK